MNKVFFLPFPNNKVHATTCYSYATDTLTYKIFQREQMNRYQKVHFIIYYKKLSKVIMYKFNPFFKCPLFLTSEHIGFLMFSEKGCIDNKQVNNLMAACASVYTVVKKFYEFYGRGCQRVGSMCSGIQFFILKLYFFLFQNPKQ